ncbi:MAG: hypothetical protein HC925_08130 [Coleofasciculaceae cyanobacterium SM2_3_26]|nr:hypothetical protein [Coleofasciculaceae cyanobacterium SM2_3_26]
MPNRSHITISKFSTDRCPNSSTQQLALLAGFGLYTTGLTERSLDKI